MSSESFLSYQNLLPRGISSESLIVSNHPLPLQKTRSAIPKFVPTTKLGLGVQNRVKKVLKRMAAFLFSSRSWKQRTAIHYRITLGRRYLISRGWITGKKTLSIIQVRCIILPSFLKTQLRRCLRL